MAQGKPEHNVTDKPDGWIVTLEWAARAFDMSPNALAKWRVDPVRESRPILYDIRDLIKHKVAYLQDLENKQKVKIEKLLGETLDPKSLYYMEKVEEQKVKTAKLKAELLDKVEVEKVVLNIFSQFRAAILAVPSRISTQCSAAETRKEAYAVLREEMFGVLKNLEMFDITQCHDNIDHLDPIEDDVMETIENPITEDLPESAVKKKRGRPRKDAE